MLSTGDIVNLCGQVVNEAEDDTQTYWLKQGQSPKAIESALEFLELDLDQPRDRLFNLALCLGYEMGKTDNGLQTYTSTN